MTIGIATGAVQGAYYGFQIGNVYGAVVGAVIGAVVGGVIESAFTPDTQTQGLPDAEQAVMSATVGGPITDACGTVKITAQLLAYGKERNVITYTESGGKGGGGGEKQETGREYYMTWQVGILACPDNPVNALYTIFKNDDVEPMWEGELECPVSGGKETIVIEGIGSVDFYFGTDDQVANSAVGEIIKDSTLNSPLRYHCWALFNDCYIGKTNRTPTYKFVLQKNPVIPELTGPSTINKYRVNPAHLEWYILHNLAGLPTSWLNEDAFQTLANTLIFEERGMCVQFNRQQTALSFLENINGHIDNILLYDTDGKFRPKLIRDDYTFDDLPVVNESDMIGDPNITSVSFIDTINEVKVQFPEIYNVGIVDNNEAYLYGSTAQRLYAAYFDGETLSYVNKIVIPFGGSAIGNYKNQIVRMNTSGVDANWYLYDSQLNNTDIVDPGVDTVRQFSNFLNGATDNITYLTDGAGGVFGFDDLVYFGGGPEVYPGSGTSYSQYLDGYIYVSEWDSPNPKMNKIRAIDFTPIWRNGSAFTTYTYRFAVLLDKIYCCKGLSGVDLSVHSTDDYSRLALNLAPVGAIFNSDIIIIGLHAYMVTGSYLYKISILTYQIIDSVALNNSYTRIIEINGQFVMVFSGGFMAVYDIISMTLVDEIATGIGETSSSVAVIGL